MKHVKYITGAFLFILSMIAVGEVYVWHLSSFAEQYTNMTFYLQPNTTQEQMIADIVEQATENQLVVFVTEKKINSLFSQNLDIYTTSDPKAFAKHTSHIQNGDFQSIFLGEVSVQILPFDQISDINSIETYYIIGRDENALKFKQALVDQYAGRFPTYTTATDTDIFTVVGIWVIVFLFLLLLTLYETSLLKREMMVRVISGHSIKSIVGRLIVRDTVLLIGIFLLTILVINPFTNVWYARNATIWSIVCFLCINALLYIRLLDTNYKKDLASKTGARSTLSFSYVFQAITVLLTVLIVSGNVLLVMNGIDFYLQHSFFERYQTSSYTMISSMENIDDAIDKTRLLYKTATKNNKVLSLVNLGTWNTNERYIFANRGAIDYLKSQINGLKNYEFENKVYFLMQDKQATDPTILQDVEDIWTAYYGGTYENEILKIKENFSLLGIQNMGRIESSIQRNPIVILNAMDEISVDHYTGIGFLTQASMYDISSSAFEQFMNEIGYQDNLHYMTNAYENYLYQWQFAKRNLYMGLVLFLLILLLECVIIGTILCYEFKVNAIEFSLKKILGYTFWGKYKKMIAITLTVGVLAVLSASLLCYFLDWISVFPVLISGLVVISIQIIFMLHMSRKVEQVNLQKILKGGQLW